MIHNIHMLLKFIKVYIVDSLGSTKYLSAGRTITGAGSEQFRGGGGRTFKTFFWNNLGGKTFFWEFFNITSFHPFYQFLSELDDFMCHFVENLGGG